jgi:hypothetical protein
MTPFDSAQGDEFAGACPKFLFLQVKNENPFQPEA